MLLLIQSEAVRANRDLPFTPAAVVCLLILVGAVALDVSGLAALFRALTLRNLVSGYECGRVFPAGVGPGSPSKDAAN